MLREFKTDMANMFSLMERMEKHMSKSCAEQNLEAYLNEAIAQNGTGNKLVPNVFVAITEDDSNKKKIINIKILPLYRQDIIAIKRTAPYSTDSKCSPYQDSRGEGISFFKFIPYRDKKLKQDTTNAQQGQATAQPQSDGNAQTADQQAPASPQGQTAPQGQAAKPKSGLASKFAAKMAKKQQPQGQQNNDDGNNVVAEGLADKLKMKAGMAKGGAQAAPNAASQAQQQPTQSSQVNIKTQTDDDIYSWLKTYYLGIVKIIARNQTYDKAAIDRLMDIDNIYQICRSTPTRSDKVYAEKSSKEMKSEIAKAIAEGKWDSYLRTSINPLNLESLIFGNVLSMRNQNIVVRKAADEGINPGDPNYPTLVLAPSQWAKFFNRRVVSNPKVAYPLTTPLVSDMGTRSKNAGTVGHEKSFGTKVKGFKLFLGYDISDTEIADPSDTTDYINGIAGILNNLTGELNQLAIDQKTAALAEKQANLSEEQKKALAEVQTEEGQAKIFNKALVSYVEQIGISVKLFDCENSTDPIYDYARNIISITSKAVEMAGYSNPSIAGPLSIISAFGIACYTIGSDEVIKIGRSNRMYQGNLKGDWDKMADDVMSTITGVIRHIYSYLNAVYSPLEGKDDNSQPTVAATDSTNVGTSDNTAQPINESWNLYAKIEAILNSL